MKRKAVKLGMLEVHSYRRGDNSQSSNLYVFWPYTIDDPEPKRTDSRRGVINEILGGI